MRTRWTVFTRRKLISTSVIIWTKRRAVPEYSNSDAASDPNACQQLKLDTWLAVRRNTRADLFVKEVYMHQRSQTSLSDSNDQPIKYSIEIINFAVSDHMTFWRRRDNLPKVSDVDSLQWPSSNDSPQAEFRWQNSIQELWNLWSTSTLFIDERGGNDSNENEIITWVVMQLCKRSCQTWVPNEP